MNNHLDESVLDSLIEGFQLIDFEWTYLYVNQSVAQQGKSSKKDLIGQTMMTKYPGIEHSEMFKVLEHCMHNRVSQSMENEFLYPDGSKGWFELRIEPVSQGLFILSMDITDRKKAEEALQKLNDSLEKEVAIRTAQLLSKNKTLTDSLHCAKRIQKAKLPRQEDIKSILPNSFVLFKPKAIVSGDFYYFHKKEKCIFLASADCTGHGVPGAMMSMLCSEKLNDSVLKFENTAEILEDLNRSIKTSLKQSTSNESTRDGMDISLCCINLERKVLRYSGANRPLWLARKDGKELEIIKGTRKAIGGFTDENQKFETHEIKLNEGDTFYIFSDGYTDLFDANDEIKISTKRFKQILMSIQNLSMEDQKLFLDNYAENWRKETEQIDDILVIGVRF